MCRSVPSVTNEKVGNVIDWTRWVSQVLVIPLLLIMGTAWWNHEEEIDALHISTTGIVSNRFTSEDGLEVWREIARLQAEIAALASSQTLHQSLSDDWINIIREHERRIGKLEK